VRFGTGESVKCVTYTFEPDVQEANDILGHRLLVKWVTPGIRHIPTATHCILAKFV